MPKNWRLDHDPSTRPLGCNGRYGDSGRKAHQRRNEPNCGACKEAANHVVRERRRGQHARQPLKPCGTAAAARRHRLRGEKPCLPCYTAEAKYHADLRAKKRNAAMTTQTQKHPAHEGLEAA